MYDVVGKFPSKLHKLWTMLYTPAHAWKRQVTYNSVKYVWRCTSKNLCEQIVSFTMKNFNIIYLQTEFCITYFFHSIMPNTKMKLHLHKKERTWYISNPFDQSLHYTSVSFILCLRVLKFYIKWNLYNIAKTSIS